MGFIGDVIGAVLGGRPQEPTLPEPIPEAKKDTFVPFSPEELTRAGVRRVSGNVFQDIGGKNTITGDEVRQRLAERPATPMPKGPPPADTKDDPKRKSDEAARKAKEDLRRRRGGRDDTILTGPLGDTGPAPTRIRTLLGS